MPSLRAREMAPIRVKLIFDNVVSGSNARVVKNSWLLLDQSSCRVIADLEHLIKNRFDIAKNCSLTLLLDNFVLPAQERVEILRDNDAVKVQQAVVPCRKGDKQVSTRKRPLTSSSSSSDMTSSSEQDNKQKKVKVMKSETPRVVKTQPPLSVPSSSTPDSLSSDSDFEKNRKVSTETPRVTVQPRSTIDNPCSSKLSKKVKKIFSQTNGQSLYAPKKDSTALKKAASKTMSSSSSSSDSSSSDDSEDDSESSSSDTTSTDNAKGKSTTPPGTKTKSTKTVFVNNSAIISKDHNYSKSNKATENNKKDGLKPDADKIPEPKMTSTPGQVVPPRKSPQKQNSAALDNSGKCLSQQHIRFDEEEEKKEQMANGSDVIKEDEQKTAAITSNNNRTEVKSQAPQVSTRESVNSSNKDYTKYGLLHGAPRVGDTVAYKILELSKSYTPEISQYKEGRVLSYDPSVQAIVLELTEQSLQRTKGDGTLTRRFELEEESESEEPEKRVTVCWSEMVEPRLVT